MPQPSQYHPGAFARMEPGRTLSSASRSLSSSSLKERLSKLSVTPLHPVAALQKNIELRLVSLRSSETIELIDEPLVVVIRFVPSRIPRKRRLQMMVVATWSVLMPLMICLFLLLWYVLDGL